MKVELSKEELKIISISMEERITRMHRDLYDEKCEPKEEWFQGAIDKAEPLYKKINRMIIKAWKDEEK